MLAYNCKQCKQFTVAGYINELNEHFCSEKCYKSYCEINGYNLNWNNLKRVKSPLN